MLKLNGTNVSFGLFPNGESYADISESRVNRDLNKITLQYESDADILRLIYLKDFIDESIYKTNVPCYLYMPYMPYSRMDRKENDRLFTLKSLARLINRLGFAKVEIWEPHSDVCVGLLDSPNVKNMSRELVLDNLQERLDLRGGGWRESCNGEVRPNMTSLEAMYEKAKEANIWFVYPDAGAAKKYHKQLKYGRTIVCNKVRDFNSGQITDMSVTVPSEFNGSGEAIMIDDILSSGGTMLECAKKLKTMGIGRIDVVATHCENTILDSELVKSGLVDQIWTTNSLLNRSIGYRGFEHKTLLVVTRGNQN